MINADGSAPTSLTNNAAHDFSPAWSPDGSRIAFVSDRDGNREIYTMNAGNQSCSVDERFLRGSAPVLVF